MEHDHFKTDAEREAFYARFVAEIAALSPATPGPINASPNSRTNSPIDRSTTVQRALESGGLTSAIATKILTPMVGEDLARELAEGLLARMMEDLAAESAIERLFAEQLVLIHLQTLVVGIKMANLRGNSLGDLDRLSTMSERLYGEFRRHLLALKAWRTPPRPMIVSRQTNIGAQQIIHAETSATIEQGANDA